MNCGTCKHWNLEHELGKMGFGTCDARKDPAHRAGISTVAQNVCRIGSFMKAMPGVIAAREQRLGTQA
ncbi:MULTISPECIES: hypothetical protein [unclassified Variovorax]|uniref:hypothetical protein n=1 Tax=unclassified Variovorax TaxID=663243 RepID=UPI00076C9A12|nr:MULTISPECIES: hypothetical protein [unclassified Variovorax]KWT89333.1 hypothetical protein APY03_3412 [Variovorax sp. WDL1]PNG56509.1 hypothetical protein CHC07_02926 [Variovorax sp. B4]PNG57933.1 hypothetical protein CHC06_02929 [Variovorax sp. B2]VTV09603.1 hypothetical protein WDL1CHR_00697 [Variovorax sp. WDL1]